MGIKYVLSLPELKKSDFMTSIINAFNNLLPRRVIFDMDSVCKSLFSPKISTNYISHSVSLLDNHKYYATAQKLQNDSLESKLNFGIFTTTSTGALKRIYHEESPILPHNPTNQFYNESFVPERISKSYLVKYFMNSVGLTFDVIDANNKEYSDYAKSILNRFQKLLKKIRFKGRNSRGSLKLFKERYISDILILKYIEITFVYEAFPGL